MITNVINKKIIRKIKIRRGIESQRGLVLFEEGEPVYIRDTKKVYVGDNITKGGVRQSYKSFIVDTNDIPKHCDNNDIIYNKNTKITYILNENKLVDIFSNSSEIIAQIQKDIHDIDKIMYRLSTEVCNPDNLLITDDTSTNNYILTDENRKIKVREI